MKMTKATEHSSNRTLQKHSRASSSMISISVPSPQMSIIVSFAPQTELGSCLRLHFFTPPSVFASENPFNAAAANPLRRSYSHDPLWLDFGPKSFRSFSARDFVVPVAILLACSTLWSLARRAAAILVWKYSHDLVKYFQCILSSSFPC